MLVDPHSSTAVTPVESSATPRRSFKGHHLRIPPRLHSRGLLHRRV